MRNRSDAAVFLLLLCLPVLGFLAGVNASTPLPEKRALAPPPALSLDRDSLAHFPQRFEAWFDDHFGFRNWLIRRNKELEWVFDRSSSGVSVGRDGWLFNGRESELGARRCVVPAQPEFAAWRELMQTRREWLTGRGIEFLWAIAPNKHTLYAEYFPESSGRAGSRCVPERLSGGWQQGVALPLVDLRPVLLDAKARPERGATRLFHRTDTHWNGLGAFVGARAIVARLRERFAEIPPLGLDAYQVEVAAGGPGGNLAEMMSAYGVHFLEDRITLRPRKPPAARLEDGTLLSNPSNNDRAEKRLVLVTGRRELPRAVVFHDSFGYALLPFLAESFERVVFVRSTGGMPMDVIGQERPDVVIALFVEHKFLQPLPRDPLRLAEESPTTGPVAASSPRP